MDTLERSKRIVELIKVFHQKTRLVQEAEMQKFNLSYGECMHLITIADGCEAINQNDLASKLNINKALVTRQLASLENKGYITRTKNPHNKRENEIALTSKAIEIIPTLMHLHQEWLTHIFSQISDKHLEIFEETLSCLVCGLEKSNKE